MDEDNYSTERKEKGVELQWEKEKGRTLNDALIRKGR